jgi:hypothetical protein
VGRRCAPGARNKRNQITQSAARIHQEIKTPRAAAVAGILFSLLAITSFLLFRISIPPNPLSQPAGMIHHPKTISVALYLVPFAGIAFLWFMGVIRDRLGEYEDRFFATVFLGSSLMFVAMIFAVAAEVGSPPSWIMNGQVLSNPEATISAALKRIKP